MSFPEDMRKAWGKKVGWKCEVCGRKFSQGWALEFHHIRPQTECMRLGINPHTYDNIKCLCIEDHYYAHVALRDSGRDDPRSADLVLARLRRTGGRVQR